MLSLFRWLSRRPLWFAHAIGALLGWITYAASPSYRRRFNENARQAGVSRAEARPAIAAAGRMVAEMPSLWLRPAGAPVARELRWTGREWQREADPRITRTHFTGTGTRLLKDNGLKAINDLFVRSF